MTAPIPDALQPLCRPGSEVFRVQRTRKRSVLLRVVDLLTLGAVGDAGSAAGLGESWYLVATGDAATVACVERDRLGETVPLDDYAPGSARPLRTYAVGGYGYRVLAKVATT